MLMNKASPLPTLNHNLLPLGTKGVRQKEKVVVVMGATGTGKSKLSIDLSTLFPSEIINSDKMQVYQGLDIVTNKITQEEQTSVPHHLLDIANPYMDFSATKFCKMASMAADSITRRRRLPIIAGGSNSFIEALVDDDQLRFRSKYECCFVWVDVALPVLHSFVSERVEKMIQRGMVEEVERFFEPNADYSQGIRRAIGVHEFDRYIRESGVAKKEVREKMLEEAIKEIKENTCKLAGRQREKINRLKNIKGWKIHRIDATEAFRKKGKEREETWKKLVTAPSSIIVTNFLNNNYPYNLNSTTPFTITRLLNRSVSAVVAAAAVR